MRPDQRDRRLLGLAQQPGNPLLRRHRRAVGWVGEDADRGSREVGRDVLRHALPIGAEQVLGDVADVRGDDDVVKRPEGVIRLDAQGQAREEPICADRSSLRAVIPPAPTRLFRAPMLGGRCGTWVAAAPDS